MSAAADAGVAEGDTANHDSNWDIVKGDGSLHASLVISVEAVFAEPLVTFEGTE
jgi:hypothetical protein